MKILILKRMYGETFKPLLRSIKKWMWKVYSYEATTATIEIEEDDDFINRNRKKIHFNEYQDHQIAHMYMISSKNKTQMTPQKTKTKYTCLYNKGRNWFVCLCVCMSVVSYIFIYFLYTFHLTNISPDE
eukprot:417532_1